MSVRLEHFSSRLSQWTEEFSASHFFFFSTITFITENIEHT